MNDSDSLARYCSRFSAQSCFLAWTVTREWAVMVCLRHSPLVEISEVTYSRSMSRHG